MPPLLDPAHLPHDHRSRFGHPPPLTVALTILFVQAGQPVRSLCNRLIPDGTE